MASTPAQPSAPDSQTSSPRKLKILMLHGFTQSGTLFRAKTRALEKALQKAFPATDSGPNHKASSYSSSSSSSSLLPNYPGGVQLVYPTGPVRLLASDIPGWELTTSRQADGGDDGGGGGGADEETSDSWGWWKGNLGQQAGPPAAGGGGGGNLVPMEKGFEVIARTLRDAGPFDGVIGFSQGGAAAVMVASLLEPGRRAAFDARCAAFASASASASASAGAGAGPRPMSFPASFLPSAVVAAEGNGAAGAAATQPQPQPPNPPLRFAVSYAGFWAAHEAYAAFYEPAVATPTAHFVGSLDSVVEEHRSRGLVEACAGAPKAVVRHPGGHFVPVGREMAAALVGFVRECCCEAEKEAEKGGEGAEDMEVPF